MRKKRVDYNKEFSYGCNAELYCDVSLESYYTFESLYNKLINSDNFDDYYMLVIDDLNKNFINCIVYSQMCIESLLNYYILLYFL